MNSDELFLEIECFQRCKNGEDACGDVFKTVRIENENRSISVLSDGLGSGIKANLLATMTSAMALEFVRNDMEILQSAEIIMDTLPVCEVRKISYATFAIADIPANGRARIVEMDAPPFLHIRNGAVLEWPHQESVSENWPDRKLRISEFQVIAGDRLIFCSDGVTQAGLGNPEYKLGWRRKGMAEFALGCIRRVPEISAATLAHSIAVHAGTLNPGGRYQDDTSCAVIYLRKPRRLRLLTGPPFKPEGDAEYAATLRDFHGKRVICGGTTANLVARELNCKLTLDLARREPGLPPPAHMEGMDLVTEGILTLTEVARALENDNEAVASPAVRALRDALLESDVIDLYVGTKVNEAHQDPTLPVDLEIRRNIVKRICHLLTGKYRKKAEIRYF